MYTRKLFTLMLLTCVAGCGESQGTDEIPPIDVDTPTETEGADTPTSTEGSTETDGGTETDEGTGTDEDTDDGNMTKFDVNFIPDAPLPPIGGCVTGSPGCKCLPNGSCLPDAAGAPIYTCHVFTSDNVCALDPYRCQPGEVWCICKEDFTCDVGSYCHAAYNICVAD